jgi:putative endonuclease
MDFFIYILYSQKFDRFYIGQTNDIQDRIRRHNSGYELATAPYKPWELKLVLRKNSPKESMELEKKIKNLSKKRIIEFIKKYSC